MTCGLRPQPSHVRKQPNALRDTTQWVNNQATVQQTSQISIRKSSFPASQKLPHHTSLAPKGSLRNQKENTLSPAKAEDKRISALSNENKTNRDSQYSTTSTTVSSKSRPKRAVGPWRLGKTIGKGATGRVRKARHEVTGQDAAVKIISKKSAEIFKSQSIMAMDSMALKSGKTDGKKLMPFGIERECVIMKLIDHPNIISLYDMWENRGELYVLLARVQQHLLTSQDTLSWNTWRVASFSTTYCKIVASPNEKRCVFFDRLSRHCRTAIASISATAT